MEKQKDILSQRYIVPPYSVLDTRKKYWRDRKSHWLKMLGKDSDSREGVLYDSLAMRMPDLYSSTKSEREALGITFEEYVEKYVPSEIVKAEKDKSAYAGASVFDPVLAEIVYHWFTPSKNSKVFDNFAGGVTRGAVANKCGHNYTGIELRRDQVASNIRRLEALGIDVKYVADDARNISKHIGYGSQDLLFTCPPYYALEVYSEGEDDASNQSTYHDYICLLSDAFEAAIQCLKSNRFAVVVISDVRDSSGAYLGLPEDVISIFRGNGCFLWNDIILLNNDSNAKLRASGYMNRRKVVRIHQRILVFYKGRPCAIPKFFPSLNGVRP